jgi:hypothetical protein
MRSEKSSPIGIERKQLLGVRHTAQRVAADRNQAAPDVADIGKRRRHQDRLIDRTAHGRNAARFVHGWANDGEVEPIAAADGAVEHFADMQAEIHVGNRLAGRCASPLEFGNTLARRGRSRQRRAAGMNAIFGREDCESAIADQFEYVATVTTIASA